MIRSYFQGYGHCGDGTGSWLGQSDEMRVKLVMRNNNAPLKCYLDSYTGGKVKMSAILPRLPLLKSGKENVTDCTLHPTQISDIIILADKHLYAGNTSGG